MNMNMVFTQSDLETVMIKVLFDNNKWFDKSNLFKETKKYYVTNEDDINICHFLFIWEMLLINTNFIKTQKKNDYEYIKISFKNNIDNIDNIDNGYYEPDNEIDFNLNISNTIDHMCKNKKICYKSKLISTFFKKNFPIYNTVYELLLFNKINIGSDNVKNFINLYSDYIETDELIDLIIYKKKINYTLQSQAVNKYFLNLKTIIGIGTGIFGLTSFLFYKKSVIKYFNWFKKN